MTSSRPQHAAASVRLEATLRVSEAILDGPPDTPYGEETFRHLLAAERKRVERSRRALLLLLVRFKGPVDDPHYPAVASELFAALKGCLREVDFVGWYDTGRVAAAVLPQRDTDAPPGASRSIAERAMQALVRRLPSPVVSRLHVRVVDVRPRMRI